MRNKLRISIDDEMSRYSLNQIHSLPPINSQSVSFNRNGQSQMMSIHKTSESSKQMAGGLHLVEPESISLSKDRQPERHKRNYQKNLEILKKSSPQMFLSAKEYNRITFNQTPSSNNMRAAPQINWNQINKRSQDHIMRSHVPFVESRFKDAQYKDQISSNRSVKNLEKVVEDLENHNKNIMKETKQTVEDFELYIQQLLEANMELQSNVQRYQQYIESLENERDSSLEQQKQRQLKLKNILKQKLVFQLELQKIKSRQNYEHQSNSHVEQFKLKISYLEEQIKSKNDLINLFEESVLEKQKIIKNMTQFNNQMCIEIMSLKANNVESMSMDLQNTSNFLNQKKKDNKNIQQFTKKIAVIQQQNFQLKQYNWKLKNQLQSINHQNESILLYIENQLGLLKNYSEQVTDLSLKLRKAERQNYSKNGQHSTIDVELNSFIAPKGPAGVIVKNIQSAFKSSKFEKQGDNMDKTFEQNFQFSEIMHKGEDGKASVIFEQEISEANKIILKKMNKLLYYIYARSKVGKLNGLHPLLKNLMTTLKQIDNSHNLEELQSDIHQNLQIKHSNQNSFLNSLEQKQEVDYNIEKIKTRNQQVLKKAREVKRRLNRFVPQSNLIYGPYSSESNLKCAPKSGELQVSMTLQQKTQSTPLNSHNFLSSRKSLQTNE